MAIEHENLDALLLDVELDHDLELDTEMDDPRGHVRRDLIAALTNYKRSRYELGGALYSYRKALPHGAWTAVVEAIATATKMTDRTIREIISDYERVRETPAPVVQALQQVGIDPSAKRQAKVVQIASAEHKAGAPPAQAVAAAVAATRKPSPQAQAPVDSPSVSKEETLIFQVRLAIRKGLERVPQNKKLEYLQIALGEEITALLGDDAREFVVTPSKPTLDLMGRKRSA